MQVNEASERWIKEGKAYKDKINNWLDSIMLDGKRPATPPPDDTRQDMAAYVLEQVKQYNRAGDYETLRRLFPPDTSIMELKGRTEHVSQALLLPDHSLIVNIGHWQQSRRVYLINHTTFRLQEGMITFGASFDKKYFAKVYRDRIDITAGWEGPVLLSLPSPNPPYAIEELGIRQVAVSPSGKTIALACEKGIFVINEKRNDCIVAKNNDVLVHPHVAISPDEKYLAAGAAHSQHQVFECHNGQWVVATTVAPFGDHPNYVLFNYDCNGGPQVLLGSCNGRAGALALPVDCIKPGFATSLNGMEETVSLVDDTNHVYAAASFEWGYFIGSDNIIELRGSTGMLFGQLHIAGGAVTGMDYTPETSTLVAACSQGEVIVFDGSERYDNNRLFRLRTVKNERRRDDMAITTTVFKDVKRYLFLKGHAPMIW